MECDSFNKVLPNRLAAITLPPRSALARPLLGLQLHIGAAMTFSHPLARSAKVFVAHGRDGTEQQILIIATTAELDPQSARYKKHLVKKLSAAARDYLARSDRVTAFLLMNPMKDWRPPGEASRHHPEAASAATIPHASPPSA
jgi:hypothetical protein